MVVIPQKEKPMIGNVLHGTDLKIKGNEIRTEASIRPESEQIPFGPQPARPNPNAHLPTGYKLSLEEIQERLHDDQHIIEGHNLIDMSPISSPRFQERIKPSWQQSLNAAFLLENDFVGAAQFLERKAEQASFQDDPEWEISAEMIVGTPFEEAAELLTDVNSQEEFDFLNAWYTDELKQREILLASGGRGLAFSVLAGVASPLSFFSFGAGIRTGSMLKGGYVGMRAGLIGTGISEAFLQTNQGFRPGSETGFAILAGTFLMGAVGSGAGALGKKAVFRGIDDIDQLIGDGVERAVQAVDGRIYGRNAIVNEKLEKLQQLSVENKEVPTLNMVRDIFLKHGDILDDSQVSGRVTLNGEVLIAPADGINSENLLRGFDSTLATTPENLDSVLTRLIDESPSGVDKESRLELLRKAFNDGDRTALTDADKSVLLKFRQELINRQESAQFLQAEVAQGISDEAAKAPLRKGVLQESEGALIEGLRKITGRKAPDEGAEALEDAWDAKLQSSGKAPDEGSDALLKAQAEDVDQLEIELGQMNGIQEELGDLLKIKTPTAGDLARINFLHFKYAGLTSESRMNRLRQMFEDAGMDTKHIDDLEGRKIDEPDSDGVDVEKLDNDAVERLRANDRDVNHENVCQ